MNKKIILTGKPQSTQHIYGHTCRGSFPTTYLKPAAKNLRTAYSWEAAQQWREAALTVPFGVTLHFYHQTNRTQDIDNFNKLVLDALTGIVWKDDSLINEMHLFKYVDKEYPRIELTVHMPTY